jgi:hypothetical protein
LFETVMSSSFPLNRCIRVGPPVSSTPSSSTSSLGCAIAEDCINFLPGGSASRPPAWPKRAPPNPPVARALNASASIGAGRHGGARRAVAPCARRRSARAVVAGEDDATEDARATPAGAADA